MRPPRPPPSRAPGATSRRTRPPRPRPCPLPRARSPRMPSPAADSPLDIPSALEWNDGFQEVMEWLEEGRRCLFVTGKAGTGKSTLLRHIRRHILGKAVVLAPTGVAAVHVGGQTIHSFFRFPPQVLFPAT